MLFVKCWLTIHSHLLNIQASPFFGGIFGSSPSFHRHPRPLREPHGPQPGAGPPPGSQGRYQAAVGAEGRQSVAEMGDGQLTGKDGMK